MAGVLPVWGSGKLSGVFRGVRDPSLSRLSPALLLADVAVGTPDNAEVQVRGGGEGWQGGSQETAPLLNPTPLPALCQGCTRHLACKEGLKCHHSHCTDEETEAWRGADARAIGHGGDLSPGSELSTLLSLPSFRLPVNSSPLPTPTCPAPNRHCHIFPPLLTSPK